MCGTDQNHWKSSPLWRTKGAFTLGSFAWSEVPNQSSIAPPSLCPRWTAFILFYLGPNRGSFASSSQQLFTPLLSNDGAGEGGKKLSALLCLRFWTVRFVYKVSVHKALTSVLRMYCKCSKKRWKRKEMRHTALCLLRKVSETHTNTFLSNNMALTLKPPEVAVYLKAPAGKFYPHTWQLFLYC